MNKHSPEGTLLIILLISLVAGLIGIFLNNNFSPWISTYVFILFGSGYYLYSYHYADIKFK